MNQQDGVILDFFYFLWEKPKDTEPKQFPFKIPETVIIRNCQPISWFFINDQGNCLKRQQVNLAWDKIQQHFLRQPSKSGIVCSFLYQDEKDSSSMQIKYMNAEDLSRFGRFLQFTEYGQGGYNAKIHRSTYLEQWVTWSPQMCLFTRRINRQPLFNEQLSIYERCATFDGPDYFSELCPVQGKLAQNLRSCADVIDIHLIEISKGSFRMTRADIFFQNDSNGNLYLLWCDSYRLSSQKFKRDVIYRAQEFFNIPLNQKPMQKNDLVIQGDNDTLFTFSVRHPASIVKDLECLKCSQKYNHKKFIAVSYAYILQEADAKIEESKDFYLGQNDRKKDLKSLDIKGGQIEIKDRAIIPLVIRKLHPQLSIEEFHKIKDNPQFYSSTCYICENCYTDLVKKRGAVSGHEKPLRRDVQPRDIHVTQPEVLKFQHQVFEDFRLNNIKTHKEWKQCTKGRDAEYTHNHGQNQEEMQNKQLSRGGTSTTRPNSNSTNNLLLTRKSFFTRTSSRQSLGPSRVASMGNVRDLDRDSTKPVQILQLKNILDINDDDPNRERFLKDIRVKKIDSNASTQLPWDQSDINSSNFNTQRTSTNVSTIDNYIMSKQRNNSVSTIKTMEQSSLLPQQSFPQFKENSPMRESEFFRNIDYKNGEKNNFDFDKEFNNNSHILMMNTHNKSGFVSKHEESPYAINLQRQKQNIIKLTQPPSIQC